MKKQSKNRIKKLDNIMPLVVLSCAVLLVAIVLISNLSKLGDSTTQDDSNASYTTIQVEFDDITTEDKEYEPLRIKCDSFIGEDSTSVSLDSTVKIDEDTYVDNKEKSVEVSKDTTMHETGPIYFQDKMLLRYLNENGDMKVVASEYIQNNEIDSTETEESEDKDREIETYDITNFKKAFKNNTSTVEGTKDTLSESEYLSDISNIFLEILSKPVDNIKYDLKLKALQYFTDDGYKSIINKSTALNVSESKLNVVFIEAGKSSLDLDTKDSIIMQIEVENNNNEKVYSTFIVKLNNSNKIFDIDII